jgi:ketosteroid isomerase-like protein
MTLRLARVALVAIAAGSASASGAVSLRTDAEEVAQLDTEFQAAVKRNDADTMTRILHPDMLLILGDGRVNTRAEQLEEAKARLIAYQIQDEDPGTQSVRVDGDTAVVTARLRIKGTMRGKDFERLLWFTDVYVRTPAGWRYFFGQASLPLPAAPGS